MLNDRLGRLTTGIQPAGGDRVVLAEIRGRVETVRSDLLADAISTLNVLPCLTEDKILQHHAQLADLVGWSAGDER